ncbi:MAG: ABC transporter permease [Methanobrevibacter sp.]|jgi:putative ABC transport system permease protein|nr:ABC transporter permease [Candidatus Methanovirga aequatorialis]
MDLLFFSFALKNIFRNKWRSTFIIVLLVIGVFALFASVTSSEISGILLDKMINGSIGNTSFGDNNNFSSLMENYSNLDYSSLNSSDLDTENSSVNTGIFANFNGSNPLNNSNISSIEDLRKEMTEGIKTLFFYLTVFLVIMGSLVIMIAMLKAVGERTREIGVLKSIGWTNSRVSGLILLESIFQLFIAWIVVIILLLILYVMNGQSINESFVNTLHMNMDIVYRIFAITFLTSLLVPIIGVIIPLLKAFRIKPSEAMRYE